MRKLITLVVVLALATATGVPMAVATEVGVRREKVEICHKSGAGWVLIKVPFHAVKAHEAHGDGYPGDSVPGTSGEYLFDDNCDTHPAEMIFAVAYTDMNTSDGGYDSAVDVLIAKFIDGNGDQVPNGGDKVTTDTYPKSFNISLATEFGKFGLTDHTIDSVMITEVGYILSSEDAANSFIFAHSDHHNVEYYEEERQWATGSALSQLQDGYGSLIVPVDLIQLEPENREFQGSPSQPEDDLFLVRTLRSDDAFDVEIYIPGG